MRCVFRSQTAGRVERHDDIDLEPDKLGRQRGKPIEYSFRRTKFKENILPFNITKFTKPFAKFVLEQLHIRVAYEQCTHPPHFLLLRVCTYRPYGRRAD